MPHTSPVDAVFAGLEALMSPQDLARFRADFARASAAAERRSDRQAAQAADLAARTEQARIKGLGLARASRHAEIAAARARIESLHARIRSLQAEIENIDDALAAARGLSPEAAR